MGGNHTQQGSVLKGGLEEHRGYLLRFALAQLRDSTRAEDAVQETLLAALQGEAQFSGKSSVKTWLTGILKHKIVDQIRKSSREPAFSDFAVIEVESDILEFDALFSRDGRHWDEPPADWGDPERSLEQKKFWEIFELCSSLMPAATARVFMMREVLGFSTEEICKDLKISATNCWVMLYRARMSLRLCLEKRWFGIESK